MPDAGEFTRQYLRPMSDKDKPLVLATNDDGIHSNFLIRLVEALSKNCEVITCAPDGERSWIGHAITRHHPLKTEKLKNKKPQHESSNQMLRLIKWALRDSNPRPPRCKRGALNQLS